MSDLGALSLGLVVGLCVVGAVLLRNEQKVREAWWRWRGMELVVHPAGPSATKGKAPVKGWMVVFLGLMTIAWGSMAAAADDAPHIILAALYLLVFYVNLRRYKRSHRPTLTSSKAEPKAS